MAAKRTLAFPFVLRTRAGRFGAALLGLWLFWGAIASARAAPASDPEELLTLQRAALLRAHLDDHGGKSLKTRLRLSALLPQLRVNVGRGWQWDYSTTSNGASVSTLGDDRLSYSLSANWDLSRILFQREEIVLRRDAQRIAPLRTQLLLRVARLYGQRCRAAAERAATSSDEARLRLAGRVTASDLSLAALTGDEHIGRKLRCASPATAALPGELETIGGDPPTAGLPDPATDENSGDPVDREGGS